MPNNPFVPARPEKMIRAEISARESSLIKTLRKYPFGEFIVYKANNLLIRVEIKDSRLIEEKNGLDLAVE